MQGGKMKTLKFVALVACLLLIMSGGLFAQEDQGFKFTVLGGLDMFGEITLENDDIDFDEDVNVGLFLGAEGAMALSETFYAGLGLRYHLPREVDADTDIEFNFIPIYALFQLNFPMDGAIVPYIVGHIGYNFFIVDADDFAPDIESEGGLYWGIGGGVYITENVSIQALYNVNYGELSKDDITIDVSYSKLTLAAAYTF